MGTFRTKIGKVRPKGPVLLKIEPEMTIKRRVIDRLVTEMDSFQRYSDKHGDHFAGMALVFWGSGGGTSAMTVLDPEHNHIPAILVPDLVRSRLLGGTITSWAMDDTLSALGQPPISS